MNTQTTTPKLTTSAMIASFADAGQKTASAPFGHALARLADEREDEDGDHHHPEQKGRAAPRVDEAELLHALGRQLLRIASSR